MKQVILAWTICLAAGTICFYLKGQDEAHLPSLSELPKCKLSSPDARQALPHKCLIQVLDLIEMDRLADGRDILSRFLEQHHDLSLADRHFSYALAQTIECLLAQTSSDPTVILPPQIFSQLTANQAYCLRRSVVLSLLREERNLAAAEQAAALAAAADRDTQLDGKAKRSAKYLFAYCLAKAGQFNLSRSCSKMGLDAAQKAADASEIALWKQLLLYLASLD